VKNVGFPRRSLAFINRWNEQDPAHHCAVGIGHVGDKLTKLGRLLNIDVVRIC
jgi:L-arabinose isomerase